MTTHIPSPEDIKDSPRSVLEEKKKEFTEIKDGIQGYCDKHGHTNERVKLLTEVEDFIYLIDELLEKWSD